MQQLGFDPIVEREHGNLGVWFCLRVDEETIVDGHRQTVDPNVLFDALLEDGKHEILTCECGEFGCGGSHVTTESADDGWRLEIGWNPPKSLVIPWGILVDACQHMVDSLRRIESEKGEEPRLAGSWPLMPHVEQFEEVVRLLRANPGPYAFNETALVPVQTWRAVVFEWGMLQDEEMWPVVNQARPSGHPFDDIESTIARCVERTNGGRLLATADEKQLLLAAYHQLLEPFPGLGMEERNFVSGLRSVARDLLGPDAPREVMRFARPE